MIKRLHGLRILEWISTFTSAQFTFTKRLLGVVLVAGGIVGFIAIIGIDVLDVGRQGGIGPAQQLALIACAAISVLGLTLIPLRDQAA
jgi:hypothetical protein